MDERMSRQKAKRRKTFNTQPITETNIKRPGKIALIMEIAAVAVLAALPFALGKIYELNQPDPFDSGAYVYSAKHILAGAKLGVDEIVSAQPATLAVNIIGVKLCGFGELGPELIQMFLQAAAIAMLYFTARRFFNRTAAVVSAALAAIYLSAPFISKYGNVKEQYMVAFIILSVCLWMRAKQAGKIWLFIPAGACAILPYYFKPTGVSIIIAIGLYLSLLLVFRRLTFRQFLGRLSLLCVGAGVGHAPLAALYAWQGQLDYLLNTFPAVLLKGLAAFIVMGFLLVQFIRLVQKYRLIEHIKSVRPVFWLTGLALILLTYLAGAAIILNAGGVIPSLDVWSFIRQTPPISWPAWAVNRITGFVNTLEEASGSSSVYVSSGRNLFGWSKQAPIVLRYYLALSLPIFMAIISLTVAAIRNLRLRLKKTPSTLIQDRFVWALGLLWLLDAALVWVSPRSYEQYYIPMCGSAAILAGYGVWRLTEGFAAAGAKKPAYVFVAASWSAIAFAMVLPIFIGQSVSPFSGEKYPQGRQRGYTQALADTRDRIKNKSKGPWEELAEYIKQNSAPKDTIYVWGWYPGIYVQAQRLCPLPRAFESEMHTASPEALAEMVRWMIEGFEKNPPLFLVDSRKRDFPWNCPPLDLWPIDNKARRFLANNQQEIEMYEKTWRQLLARYGPDEALRFDAMKPLREYVMSRYKIVNIFGPHVLFIRKQASPAAG